MNFENLKNLSDGDARTGHDWQQLLYPKLVILDYDGFDRRDLQYSFYQERISRQEFENRLSECTIIHNTDYLKSEENDFRNS
jgi:hypothetical protein